MIITVASDKGGACKTMTAVHLAKFLEDLAPGRAALLDDDPTKNSTAWSQRGSGFPFVVAPGEHLGKLARTHEHLVIDSGQRPEAKDLQASAEGSDLLVVPTVPSALDTDGLGQTVRALTEIGCTNYCVLLTRVAPDARRQVEELRAILRKAKVPVFATEIPRLKAFEKAAAEGVTVDKISDPNAMRAWAAYKAVGREVLKAVKQ